jgi:ATP-dependent DNA helicase RecQ
VALSARTKKPRAIRTAVPDDDRDFWEALRGCRQLLASEHKVPPYVIFHDATLRQFMALRPTDAEELLGISGVGQAKLQRYGEAFLNVIREYA